MVMLAHPAPTGRGAPDRPAFRGWYRSASGHWQLTRRRPARSVRRVDAGYGGNGGGGGDGGARGRHHQRQRKG